MGWGGGVLASTVMELSVRWPWPALSLDFDAEVGRQGRVLMPSCEWQNKVNGSVSLGCGTSDMPCDHGRPEEEEHGRPEKEEHGRPKKDEHRRPEEEKHGRPEKEKHGRPPPKEEEQMLEPR